MRRPARLCVVGDELVAGIGDPRALGWVGRVAVRTRDDDDVLAASVMGLGVPGEDSASLRERWPGETARRWERGADRGVNRLVVGLGHGDAVAGTTLARSRLNVADIVDSATQAGLGVFVVGPPPPGDSRLHRAVAELNQGWQDVAQRRGVAYVDCFTPLVDHEQWFADLAPPVPPPSDASQSGGAGGSSEERVTMPTVPGQVGYGLLAWLVLHGGWHRWLGLTPPQ